MAQHHFGTRFSKNFLFYEVAYYRQLLLKTIIDTLNSLNFAFMLVQFFYGFASGSLGLLSDSIHMLFDCLALAVGLCAAVMSKWPPSMRFPYGYGKIDTLAGFANGIFLMYLIIGRSEYTVC